MLDCHRTCQRTCSSRLLPDTFQHSHDDAGYRETLDGYYTQKVQHIIGQRVVVLLCCASRFIHTPAVCCCPPAGGPSDSYVEWLSADSTRRFQQVETVFFSKWWANRGEAQHEAVRKLVAAGQLEFVGGGWVMHDEATTDVYGVMTQLTTGRQWLQDTLGVTPTVLFQCDPFGASVSTPYIASEFGYKMVVLNRIPDLCVRRFPPRRL